ncbi:hypothetical protein ADUPG1_011686, partial [Aduncisulcus paluster]
MDLKDFKPPFLDRYGSRYFANFVGQFEQYRARNGRARLFTLIDLDTLPLYCDVSGAVLTVPPSDPDEAEEKEIAAQEETFLKKVESHFGSLSGLDALYRFDKLELKFVSEKDVAKYVKAFRKTLRRVSDEEKPSDSLLKKYFLDGIKNPDFKIRCEAALDGSENPSLSELTAMIFQQQALVKEGIEEFQRYCSTPFKRHSDPRSLSLFTDASDVGIGAVLVQGEDENRSVVSFISKTLTSVQRRWSVTEKECWAIVFAITQFERFLKGRHFDLFTDHRNLTFVQRSPNAKITRWWLRIQEFSFSVHHVKGEENGAADCCSRLVEFGKNALKSLKLIPDKEGEESPKRR